MSDRSDPIEDIDAVKPSIAELARQLVDDGRAFAQAEASYLKAQVGERANYALPGVAMIGAAIGLATGGLVASVVGLMLLLSEFIGFGWSVIATLMITTGTAYALVRIGTNRIKASLKARDKR